MNSITKKLLIFGGIVAVIIIFIALKKKQDEEKESGEGEAKLPSIGLVPANIVPIVQNENTGIDNTPDDNSQQQQTGTVLLEANMLPYSASSQQPAVVKGNNFFDGMKC